MTRQFEIRIDGRPAFRADRYVYSYKNLDAEDASSVEIAAAGPTEYVVDLMDVEVLPGLTLRPAGEPDEGNAVAWLNMQLATAKSRAATMDKQAEHHRTEMARLTKERDSLAEELGKERYAHAEAKRDLDNTRYELTQADERHEALEGTLLQRGQMLGKLRGELDQVAQQRDVAYRDRETWKGRHAEAEEARVKAVRLARLAEDSRDEWRKLSKEVAAEQNAVQRQLAETKQDREVWAARYEAAEKSHLEQSKLANSRYNELLETQGELMQMDQQVLRQAELIGGAWDLIQPVRSTAKASFKADWQEKAMYWAMRVRGETPQDGVSAERAAALESIAKTLADSPRPLDPKEAHETLQRVTGAPSGPSALTAMDDRTWRVGGHYDIHLYAEDPHGVRDEPIATALKPGFAWQIAREHNAERYRRQRQEG
jgi:hypothetical protein